ncbi:MAG: GTA-gp10 family protein [Caulobacteraceae bacterium]
MTHANRARGEVVCRLAGADRRLCLTLGALAELEGAFSLDGIGALAERLKSLSARDLMAVLAALLRGGGEHEAAETLDRAPIDLREAADAVAAAFKAAGE